MAKGRGKIKQRVVVGHDPVKTQPKAYFAVFCPACPSQKGMQGRFLVGVNSLRKHLERIHPNTEVSAW